MPKAKKLELTKIANELSKQLSPVVSPGHPLQKIVAEMNPQEFWDYVTNYAQQHFPNSYDPITKQDFTMSTRTNLFGFYAHLASPPRKRTIIGKPPEKDDEKNIMQNKQFSPKLNYYKAHQEDEEWRCKCKQEHNSLEEHRAALAKIKNYKI